MVAPPRILIVDDEPGVVESALAALRPHYEVLTADRGAAALEALGRHPVDLVLLGDRLPDLLGLEILHQIKRRSPSVLVILMSAHGSEEVCRDFFHGGGRHYLRKPFGPGDLLEAVEKLLAARRQAGEARTPVLLTGTATGSPGDDGSRDLRIQRAMALSEGRLEGRLTVLEVSREVGMSKSHFSRAFKRETGLTVRQFVLGRRVALAKVLLRDSTLPVSEIAARVGFNDPAHFNRAFHTATGYAPSRYRAYAQGGLPAARPAPEGPQGAPAPQIPAAPTEVRSPPEL